MQRDFARRLVSFALSLFFTFSVCANEQTAVDTPSKIRQALAALEGSYRWRADLKFYLYSEQQQIESIISALPPKVAVSELIWCLDDRSTSMSTFEGKRVNVGLVCYTALTQLAYYEHTNSSGSRSTHWPGLISPRASSREMQRAKAAWKKAEAAKLLILL